MNLKEILKIQLWDEKPLLRSPDHYISAVNTARYLEGKHRILIVGDAGGREWRYLKQLEKELYVLDIVSQESIPNLYIQSIEQKTPFEDNFFDGIVMNEVLEHLFLDVQALEEVHRILKKNGILVVTVPYMSNKQDFPEHHVRVHSPKTIRRLLEKSGFEIEEHFCRGFSTRLLQLSLIIRAFFYLIYKLTELLMHKTPNESVAIVNQPLERLERWLGIHRFTIRFQKLFASYGGVMKAKRSQKKDFDAIQKQDFVNSSFH